MNKGFIVLALATVTFIEGFLGTLIATGVTGLDASAIQAAAVGASGSAMSVVVNGIGRLHRWLAARNA